MADQEFIPPEGDRCEDGVECAKCGGDGDLFVRIKADGTAEKKTCDECRGYGWFEK